MLTLLDILANSTTCTVAIVETFDRLLPPRITVHAGILYEEDDLIDLPELMRLECTIGEQHISPL